MKLTIQYFSHISVLIVTLLLAACNTTQEKKPDVATQTPSSQTKQSSNKQDTATSRTSSSQQKASQANKSDDEILNDALEELERKKTQQRTENSETANTSIPSATNSTQNQTNNNLANTPPTGSLTSGEKTQQLDSKLDESFADFDALLLKEQERLTQEQNEQGDLSNSGGAGAASGGYGYEEGDGFEEAGGDISIASEQQEPQQSSGSNPFPSETTQADIPPDLVSTKGDDVIARQLREAALKEKDPELREKLWDEYRKYKQGVGR